MNPTTSLDFSRKLFEIIGEQETEHYANEELFDRSLGIPAYTFGELLKVIPLIAEKKGWKEGVDLHTAAAISFAFISPTIPEQGMKDVEDYLMTML